MLALVYSGGLWAGPLGGYLSDRLGKTPVILTSSIIVGPVIYLTYVISYGWGVYVLLLMIGMSMYIHMTAAETYLIGKTSEKNRSTILGIYYFGSRGGPGFITPVIGHLTDNFGFGVSFGVIAAVILAVTLICGIFLLKEKR